LSSDLPACSRLLTSVVRIIVKANASWHDAIHLNKRLSVIEYGRTARGVGMELLLVVP
jgi:hypothetical protein